tara:strand:- start:32 stop:1372 length:1341 start_codon:yes stop_codon:yes gene_type:complete
MANNNYIDKLKLNRWLNIRKITLAVLNKELKNKINFKISLENCEKLDDYALNVIAEFLDITPSKLKKNNSTPTFIHKSKIEIEKTRRPINKDGIHFYNYYTLPTPKGYVSPVLLDILCPKDKLPKLNNGHLEPAITISMGPNDIYARFAEKLNKTTWVKFKINKDPKTNWIVGSSYYEPSFCKHSYSQAENGLGRIISYTTRSNIENLLNGKLNDNSYFNLMEVNKNRKINRTLLKLEIESKGYSLQDVSKKIGISYKKLKNYFENSKKNLKKIYIISICKLINSDSNLFFDKMHKEDSVGKFYFDHKDSIKTIRNFKSYKVASIVNSKRFPDLSGYYLKVKNFKKHILNDLFDSKCSHYFVTSGKMMIHIKDKHKKLSIDISEGDCLWMSAFTHHGFTGNGSLLKISDGQNINYLEKEDLINTYDINNVFKRAKDDMKNWGYDEK